MLVTFIAFKFYKNAFFLHYFYIFFLILLVVFFFLVFGNMLTKISCLNHHVYVIIFNAFVSV